MSTRAYVRALNVSALVGLLAGVGCAGVKPVATSGTGGSSSRGGSFGSGGSTGSGGSVIVPTGCNGPCTDFEPTASNPNPIFQVNVDPGVAGMFNATGGPAPCVTEPEDGSLFPNNWLAPRVHVPGNTGYLKITFHTQMESTDLVAYAQGDTWVLPKPIWQNLAAHINDQNITITVQTTNGGATSVNFQIAPVGAGGSMVFWSMDPNAVGKDLGSVTNLTTIKNDSFLDGFTVGDDSTLFQASGTPALSITDVKQQVAKQDGSTQPSHCIGCHVGTPDGNYVGFVDGWPWGGAFASIQASTKGASIPTYPGASCTNWNTCTGSRTYLQYPWMGGMAFSQGHWSAGDQIAIVAAQMPTSDLTMPWATDDYQMGNLVWVDTESSAITTNNGQPFPARGMAFDYMQHTGDLGGVAFPTWSNDGTTIVYSSTPGGCATQDNSCPHGDQDGRLNKGHTDLYSVQYNNRAGGAATPVPGASSTTLEEYYAAFSPDDSMLAFTAVQSGQVMYANPVAELYVTPFATPSGLSGAQAIRLNANDPPKCTGLASPGINNHWAKWSPTVGNANNKSYYWMIFSSNRYNPKQMTVMNGNMTNTVYVSQLYMTAVVKNEVGYVTYPAVYLYNQPPNRLNTTPAWQDFHIPIVIDKP